MTERIYKSAKTLLKYINELTPQYEPLLVSDIPSDKYSEKDLLFLHNSELINLVSQNRIIYPTNAGQTYFYRDNQRRWDEFRLSLWYPALNTIIGAIIGAIITFLLAA